MQQLLTCSIWLHCVHHSLASMSWSIQTLKTLWLTNDITCILKSNDSRVHAFFKIHVFQVYKKLFLMSLTYSTPRYVCIIRLALPQYFRLQCVFRAAGTRLDPPWGVQQCIRLQASHRFLDSYEALIAHVQKRKLTIAQEEAERGRRGRQREGEDGETGQHNERRDSRSAHDDGLEETLCGSQVSTRLLACTRCILLSFSASLCWCRDNNPTSKYAWCYSSQLGRVFRKLSNKSDDTQLFNNVTQGIASTLHVELLLWHPFPQPQDFSYYQCKSIQDCRLTMS